jgi:cell fate regulator YaaT (PSP1 superfamily)
MTKTSQPDRRVAGVRFQPTGKTYHFDATAHPDLKPGDFVLVETARGQQLGEVINVQPLREDDDTDGLKAIQRQATSRDLALRQHWQKKEAEALNAAREAVKELGLPIKVVIAEYTFDGQRLTLLYVSDEKKLDLGALQQRLQGSVSGRVDLRLIGVRDQAKLMGGYGACGELRCCPRFLADFSPVSIKMAKTQGVSLDPTEITGMCGRLRCCLVYEEEQYQEACKMMPRRKKLVHTPFGDGKVVDLLPLKGMVVVQLEDRRVEVPAEDVELIQRP